MNSDDIISVLTVVAASIPLIIAIFALFRNKIERTTEPIDSQALNILKIKRYPVDNWVWKKTKRVFFIIHILGSFSGMVYIIYLMIINIFDYINFQFSYFYLWLVLTTIFLLIFGIISTVIFLNSYKFIFKSANEARYYLFKDIDIIIESDYRYLFNRCLETFRSLNYQVAEIDEKEGSIEASQLLTRSQTKIRIEPVDNSTNTYVLKLEFIRPKDFERRSKLINRFINQLISKPKSANQKTDDKKDVPSEVGD